MAFEPTHFFGGNSDGNDWSEMILLLERVTQKANLQEIVPNVLVQASIIWSSCGHMCDACSHHLLISTGAIKKKHLLSCCSLSYTTCGRLLQVDLSKYRTEHQPLSYPLEIGEAPAPYKPWLMHGCLKTFWTSVFAVRQGPRGMAET